VLSVNFTCSAPASLGLVALVSVEVQGEWSSWLRLLRWGDPRFDSGVTESAFGRVRVEELSLTRPARAARYQVIWQSRESACRLRRVALCLANTTPVETPNRPDGKIRLLGVPFLSQWEVQEHPPARICSPTCLAMLATYYGVRLSSEQLAGLAFDSDHDLYGNWSVNMLALSLHGFRAVVERASRLSVLDDALAAGQPLVTSIAFGPGKLTGAPLDKTDGHLVVVCGLTQAGDYVTRDPAARGQDDWRTYARSEFKRAWLGHGGVFYRVQPEKGA
jgi:hypothetical protein